MKMEERGGSMEGWTSQNEAVGVPNLGRQVGKVRVYLPPEKLTGGQSRTCIARVPFTGQTSSH